jgi:N-acetylglucosamine-6-phosphate deacetylase
MKGFLVCRGAAFLGVLVGVSVLSAQPTGQSPLNPPPNGMRRAEATSHALVGATVHVKPGQTLQEATVLIRDGRIEAVGKVEPGPGVKVWDCKGLHIYAGFIDPFVEVDAPAPDRAAPGVHWNARVTPQRRALDGTGVDERTAESFRKLGFTAAAIVPRGGIFRGSSAVVSLAKPATELSADRPPVYAAEVFQTVGLDTGRVRGAPAPTETTPGQRPRDDSSEVGRWSGYPDSQMGVIALIRQTLIDADWQAGARTSGDAIASNCLDTIAAGKGRPVLWFDVSDELEALRAVKIAKEFGRQAVIVGSGTEYQRLEAIKQSGVPIVVPLAYPRNPDVATIGKAESVDLRELMAWEQAPTNPRRLEAAGVKTALTTAKLRSRTDFTDNLTKALKHGLDKDVALAMVTTRPAELLGVAGVMGTIEKGRVANLVVAEADLFEAWPKKDEAEKPAEGRPEGRAAGEPERGQPAAEVGGVDSPEVRRRAGEQPGAAPGAGGDAAAAARPERRSAKIRDVWVDGVRHEISPPPGLKLEGTWEVRLEPAPQGAAKLTIDDKNAITVWLGEKRSRARSVSVTDARVSFVVDDEALGLKGVSLVSGVVEGEEMHGTGVNGEGQGFTWTAKRTSKTVEEPRRERGPRGERPPAGPPAEQPAGEPKKPDDGRPAQPAERPNGQAGERQPGENQRAAEPRKSAETLEREAIAAVPEKLGVPFGPYAVETYPSQQEVLLMNATVWTAGPAGIIENGAVLISADGKINYVGPMSGVPRLAESVQRVDLKGKHIAPGIIDCHSHTGISRGVNEGGQAVTAEVRIGDVTDPDAISWYRQLAAGVTAVNNLHGSANAIGGQNQVNKVRWGVTQPDQMHMEGAAPGIKFALGENPRQVNFGGGGGGGAARYPQTRMGVETLIRDRFTAAKEYAAKRKAGGKDAPRRDLELDALAEILEGKRLIHCHSYRQDEILMLCRVADDFGFKIGTFQHVLEGYKVADEIARHALGGSCFTDWWAYKVEVQDAIAAGGPIMAEQGVVVSFNSDSDELARRLNSEAAKAIKYGLKVSPEDAIRYVTLNPARQLKISDRVGSLEVGKDADLAVWSGSPISSMSRCEATYVDGRRLFSLEDDAASRTKIQAERTRLIQKALAQGSSPRTPEAGGTDGPPGGGFQRRRPTEDDDRAGMLRQYYLDLMTRGIDPEAARPGECGCGVFHE